MIKVAFFGEKGIDKPFAKFVRIGSDKLMIADYQFVFTNSKSISKFTIETEDGRVKKMDHK